MKFNLTKKLKNLEGLDASARNDDFTLGVGTLDVDDIHLTEFLDHLASGGGRALQAKVIDLDLAGLRRSGSFTALLDGLLGEADAFVGFDGVGLADGL